MTSRLVVVGALFSICIAGVHMAEDKSEELLKPFTDARKELGVYMFSSSDYPAIFAIIGGVSLALILAVIFIVVGLLSMEPNKDSIIYRMTTTRMKKD